MRRRVLARVDAEGGTLTTTVLLNKTGAGNLTLGGGTAINLDATVDVDAGNLVIEISWEGCADGQSFYTYSWDTGTIRSLVNTVAGAPSNPTGTMSSAMSRLKLSGTISQKLASITFGSLKSLFNN